MESERSPPLRGKATVTSLYRDLGSIAPLHHDESGWKGLHTTREPPSQ